MEDGDDGYEYDLMEEEEFTEYDREKEEAHNKEVAINSVCECFGKPWKSPGSLVLKARSFNVVTQVLELVLAKDHYGYSFADYNSLCSEIENLFKLDDRDQFAVYLTKYYHKLFSFGPQDILYLAVEHSAVQCLTALLDSPLRSHVDVRKVSSNRFEAPLNIAARQLCLGMVTLLLQHGADPNSTAGGYALEYAILRFSAHDFLRNWNPRKSVIELFNLISSPQMKESLDIVKLLASQTKEIMLLCDEYVSRGLIVEFATLLTAASDKLLAQIEKGLENTLVGQYIFGELKCDANQLCGRISNGISSSLFSKEKYLVDGFNVVKTFCFIHGLDKSPGQLVLKGAAGYEDTMEEYKEYTKEREVKNEAVVIDHVGSLYWKPWYSPGYHLQMARSYNTVTQVLEMGLGEDHTGTSLADYNSMYSQIENILKLDDLDQFAAYLRNYHDKLLSFDPEHIVYLAITHSAVGCLSALLDSQLRSHVDVSKEFSNMPEAPLNIAAGKLSSGMVTLLLQLEADPDFQAGGYPLYKAIDHFSAHDFVRSWSAPESFIKLFNLISSPQLEFKFVHEKWLVREHANKENVLSWMSKFTSKAGVVAGQKHFGLMLGALIGEQRIGIARYSTFSSGSHVLYQPFLTRHFNHKLVETLPSKCTPVKPSLVKKVAPVVPSLLERVALVMWLAKKSFK